MQTFRARQFCISSQSKDLLRWSSLQGAALSCATKCALLSTCALGKSDLINEIENLLLDKIASLIEDYGIISTVLLSILLFLDPGLETMGETEETFGELNYVLHAEEISTIVQQVVHAKDAEEILTLYPRFKTVVSH